MILSRGISDYSYETVLKHLDKLWVQHEKAAQQKFQPAGKASKARPSRRRTAAQLRRGRR